MAPLQESHEQNPSGLLGSELDPESGLGGELTADSKAAVTKAGTSFGDAVHEAINFRLL